MGAQSGNFATLADLPDGSSPGVTPETPEGVIITNPSQVSFVTAQVQPPTALYVGLNDYLIINCYAPEQSAQITISGRLLEPDGSVKVFQQVVQVTAPQSGQIALITLTEGFLLNVTLSSTITTFQRGLVFFVVQLARGPQGNPYILQALLSNYMWTGASLQWPGSPLINPTEGPGALTIITAAPAAGQDFSLTPAAQVRWRVFSVSAVLATDATVGNRVVQFGIKDGSNNIPFETDAPANQVASTGFRYTWTPAQQRLAAFSNVHMGPLPDPCYIPHGVRIVSATSALDAGDQWSSVVAQVEKWVDV